MDRVATGILGFDELIEGGFPRGRSILVSGAAGCGKTIFSTQFLVNGIKDHDEPGILLTLDEGPNDLRQDMKVFGWDLAKLEKQDKLAIIDASTPKIGVPSEERFAIPDMNLDYDRLLYKVMQVADQIGAKRAVIDSIAGLGWHMQGENDIRKSILKTGYMLSRSGLTSILTSEIPNQGSGSNNMISKYGVEEYVTDGVITLHYHGAAMEAPRTLFVRKMRSTSHSESVLPMKITKRGIMVLPAQD